MIHLNLAIHSGDVEVVRFHTLEQLCEYIKELEMFNCIWLAADDSEIMVTESIPSLVRAIETGHFNLLWSSPQYFYVQEYQSYEDAYSVALSMREPNPKCYS